MTAVAVHPTEITAEGLTLLDWVRPDSAPDWETKGLDAARLTGLIEVQRVGPWLYRKWKEQPGADAALGQVLKHEAVRSIAQTAIDRRARKEVLTALLFTGVAPIPLKGTVLGTRLYGDPSLRPSHDLDVLVPPAQFALATLELKRIGFRQVHRKNTPWLDGMSHEMAFWRGDELPVELHRHITQPRRFAVPLAEVLERCVPWEWEGLKLRRLSDEDMFLHLVIHAAHHQFLLPLSHWLDLELMIRSGINLELVRERAVRYRSLTALRLVAGNLNHLLGNKVLPDSVGRLTPWKARVLHGLEQVAPAESDTKGPLKDRWHAFWLIERPADRVTLAAEYFIRWALDRPFAWRAYKSRQLRSNWGWRSIRFPFGMGLSSRSVGRRGSPQTSQ